MPSIEERKAWVAANRDKFTPGRLLEVTERINRDQAIRAKLRQMTPEQIAEELEERLTPV